MIDDHAYGDDCDDCNDDNEDDEDGHDDDERDGEAEDGDDTFGLLAGIIAGASLLRLAIARIYLLPATTLTSRLHRRKMSSHPIYAGTVAYVGTSSRCV